MDTLTAQGTGAGGLATRVARWALVFAWTMGAVKALVDGQFNPAYVTLPFACILCLVAVVLLTRRENLPLTGLLAALVAALVLTATALALAVPPDQASIWQVHFGAKLIALLFVRGNLLHAGIGAIVHSTMLVAWGLQYAMPISWISSMMASPLVVYALGILWLLALRRVVAQERGHRSEAAEHARQIKAEHEAAEHIGRELALVRSKTEHVLARIRDGAPLDDELRAEIAVVEGEIRDRIRSPRLQHPELNEAIAAARARGAAVTVLAEGEPGAPRLGERAAREAAAILHSVVDADSIVIAWTEPERVSIVAQIGGRSERYVVEVGDFLEQEALRDDPAT